MRILLIPPKNNYPEPGSSLEIMGQGFPYIAGALGKAGHEVFGINLNLYRFGNFRELAEVLLNRIGNCRPDLIGLGGLSADFAFVRDMMAVIRAAFPRLPILCGGGMITYDAEYVFTSLKPDYALNGEAELNVVQLAEALENRGDLSIINNLLHWVDGKPAFNRVVHDNIALDGLPYPDYEPFEFEKLLGMYNQTDNIVFGHTRLQPRILPITLGRSCPFSCTFCCHTVGPRYRQRSIDDAIKEIRFFYEKYRFNILFIYDELFSVNRERLLEFCARLEEAKRAYSMDFDWTCDLRVPDLDSDVLFRMKQSGCAFIGYGLESANDAVLKNMRKNITADQIARAIQLTSEAGIGVQGNFIFGDPAETLETIEETVKFFMAHCREHIVHLNYLTPYPGSQLFEHCLQNGLIEDRDNYYARIGLIGRFRINMTAISDSTFYPLVDAVLAITAPNNNETLLLAEGGAVLVEDPDSAAPLRLGTRIVQTVCPHCSGTVRFALKGDACDGRFRTYCGKCHKRFVIPATTQNIAESPFERIQRVKREMSNIIASGMVNSQVDRLG